MEDHPELGRVAEQFDVGVSDRKLMKPDEEPATPYMILQEERQCKHRVTFRRACAERGLWDLYVLYVL